MTRFSMITAAITLLAMPGRAPCQIDEAWVKQSKPEIESAIGAYRSLARELDEATVLRYEPAPMGGNATYRKRTIHFSLSCLGDNLLMKRLATFDDDVTKPSITVEGRNPDYSFVLSQTSLDAPYVLTKCNQERPMDALQVEGGFFSIAYQDFHSVLRAINGESGYKLVTMKRDLPKNCLFVTIQSTRQAAKNAVTIIRELWIDTTAPWHLLERKITSPSQVAHSVVTYGPTLNSLPCPSKVVEVVSSPKSGAIRVEMSLEIKKTTKSVADFRLSAFGLPEPIGAPAVAPRRTYLWFVAAGVICAGLAVLVRYYMRRKYGMPA